MNNSTTTKTKPSRTLLTERRHTTSLDIWDNLEIVVRIYPDRTIIRRPCRQYSGENSWGLGESVCRYTGPAHQTLLTILEQEREDQEDYTGRIMRVALFADQDTYWS